MRPGTFGDHVHQAFTEAVAYAKALDDIAYVAEFGHPAIDRKDDSAALEWIRQTARSCLDRQDTRSWNGKT